MTPNQVVAANLIAAREELRLTQGEAAERIEPYLGARWSKAAFSARERSVDGARIREFTADELVAMAMAFDRPIAWFFLPTVPPEGTRFPDVDPSNGRGGYDAILACETLIQLASSSKTGSLVERLTKLLQHDGELRALSFNRRARPMASQIVAAVADVVAALAGASDDLSQLLPVDQRRIDSELRGSADDAVGHKTLVALADEVIGIGHRLEAIEKVLGIGEGKDNPDARTRTEEG